MVIPFILYGTNIKAGYEIKNPLVRNIDTTATCTWALGLDLHPSWVASPIIEAFL